MNICFYTDQTISGMTGGIGRVTEILTNYFRLKYGWKVFSIYGAEAKTDCPRTITDGSICLRLHDRLNVRKNVKKNTIKAVDYLRRNDIDVFFIQTSLDVVKKIRKELDKSTYAKKIKIISVLHFEPGKDEWKWNNKGLKGIIAPVRNMLIHKATVKAYKEAYELGDMVSVLSESYISKYKDYSHITDCDKLFAFPNPLSFEDSVQKQKDKKKIAVVVARMEESQKRISLILKLWKKIDDKGYILKIVGDGPNLNEYKNIAKQLHLINVHFEGRKNPVPYYKEASIFLMTSAFEGFPMTLVEAQQFGCVPIVFDSFSALRDVVEHNRNGIIIKDKDTESFVDAIMLLMNDNLKLNTLSQNAINDSKRFSQSIVCDKWKEKIESL